MRTFFVAVSAFVLSLGGFAVAAAARAEPPQTAVVAATPPMGWSSWSALRGNITEDKIKAEAQVMQDKLRSHGYEYINIDSGWTDHLDAYGRDAWNTTKFPDGIPALAAYVHHLGLKFGIYMLPGIPKAAVAANTPIYGTPYHASDIADTSTEGNTYTDSWRIDYSKPGAASYVQSYADLFASWGVDYIKMDFVGPGGGQHPADNRADIEHWHYALQNTGRPIHLELSNSLSFTTRRPGRPSATGGASRATSSATAVARVSSPTGVLARPSDSRTCRSGSRTPGPDTGTTWIPWRSATVTPMASRPTSSRAS